MDGEGAGPPQATDVGSTGNTSTIEARKLYRRGRVGFCTVPHELRLGRDFPYNAQEWLPESPGTHFSQVFGLFHFVR